ncbi:unnamed protein product [Spirodela intermedia]|uniref:Uncharacterized protein n=1 Tax=Spirodela intermedia TaxID=51605 RepID=A0A7I8LFG0_SPIIN|nr:unnamed protein product [Spirodela intermedia]
MCTAVIPSGVPRQCPLARSLSCGLRDFILDEPFFLVISAPSLSSSLSTVPPPPLTSFVQ